MLDLRREPDRDPTVEPVQLLEGYEYRYEIELTSGSAHVETDPAEIFQPDSNEGTRGRLRPRLYTGMLPITIRVGGSDVGRVALEVRSRKLDHLSHYRWMLRDVAERYAELVMERFAPTEQRFAIHAERDAATLYQRFAFLQSLLAGDAFDAATHQVLSRPHRAWVDEYEPRYPGQGIPGSSTVARQLHAPGPRLRWPGVEHSGRSLPARITVARTEETLDTPANRFIKFALTRWRDTAADIGEALRREEPSAPVNRGLREVEALTNRLDALLSEELFREVGPLTQFPAGDQVLQKREGYRDLFRTYVQFEAAAVLSWQGGEDVYGAGQRDVATLYEFWVFLQLAGVVAKICQRSFDLSQLVEVNPDHLGVGLRRGRQTVVSGSVDRLGRTLHVELWFDRSFGARGAGSPSWTREMRPDCSLRISIDRETSAPFKEGEDVWLHFDAKYRVEDLGELFDNKARANDEGGEAVVDQEATDTRGESKADDLLKMHAYRDAIRRSAGAYVLYPGTERQDCRLYHEILPGLGAFALRPTEHGDVDGILPLEVFIDAVIDHVALQASQDERARFWMREAHAHWGAAPARSHAAPFLTRPPADTLVLLAPAKNPDHLEWIRTHRLYNVRAGERRGSVGLGSRELAAEFVLVYEARTENAELWVVTGEPMLVTQEQLLQMAYPDPRGDLYYCLELEPLTGVSPAIEIALDRVQELRRQVPGKVRGAPVAVTWLVLVNAS